MDCSENSSPEHQRINRDDMAAKPWSDLPLDLLSVIADRLGLIELLSFRGVCKNWNFASYTASAEIESSPDRLPWLLLYGEDGHCQLYSGRIQDRRYSLEIPELAGATCIASNYGWLLLFREGPVFFFCPFSRAKIDLPNFPCSELSDRVASFSSPPTSQDCVVAISRSNGFNCELNLLYHGASSWNQCVDNHQENINTIKGAVYHNGFFHFFDIEDGLLKFSVKEKSFKKYRIVHHAPQNSVIETLPFEVRETFFEDNSMMKRLGIEEDVSVSICGTLVPFSYRNGVVFNKTIKAAKKCESFKGVWLQPRFFQIPSNQSWSL